jgi:hypothetical protein
MPHSETLYERRKKLEATIRHEQQLFKFVCILVIVVLCTLTPILLCWHSLFSKPH